MSTLNESIREYKKQLEKGDLQKAYRGLLEYIADLRMYFKNKYPEYAVPGNMYFGYMDMTYFPLFPESLKKLKLKIAVVFIHDALRFEVWLSGLNKQIQAEYWKLIKESNWNQYRLPSTTKGADSILEHTLVENPDFGSQEALTRQIETGTLKFIRDIEAFLAKH
ncbi:MAG: hypothetical protein JXA73_00505 [Acidobacteria bacterium]|nr:hypothetical protein [Acidobacteriota bacterium]